MTKFSVCSGVTPDPRHMMKPKRGRTKKSSDNHKSVLSSDKVTPVGGKDSSLLIFRALGKVLYCKRE